MQLNSVLLYTIILQTEAHLTWHIFGYCRLDSSSTTANTGHASTCCSALALCSHRSASAVVAALNSKGLPTPTHFHWGGQRDRCIALTLALTAWLDSTLTPSLSEHWVTFIWSELCYYGLYWVAVLLCEKKSNMLSTVSVRAQCKLTGLHCLFSN